MGRENRYEYTDWKGFGSRVRKCREQVGLTLEKFAEEVNRSENFISELEKGRLGCSIHTLYKISKVLKVSTDYLLYGDQQIEEIAIDNGNKEILQNIINRCNNDELKILKEVIVAVFPNIDKIIEKNSQQ